MNNNSNILTGILSITQKGGMRLLRGANNATESLIAFKDLPVWPPKPQHESKKGWEINNMPLTQPVVTVFKHVEQYQPSQASLRELFPNKRIIKDKPWPYTPQETLEAFILDCIYDTFQSTRGVSYKFQTSDGKTTVVKSFT